MKTLVKKTVAAPVKAANESFHEFYVGDCLELMKEMPDNSVDLVFTSPPYEDARLYGDLGFNLVGQAWVDWAVERFVECCRVSKGLVAWVVEGKTRKFQWSATPALMMADLHRKGIKLRNPPIFHRVGIPGSGGPDWLRNDKEWIVCASKGKLPWSDNTIMGHPPKYAPGGEMSHRRASGERVNKWGGHSGVSVSNVKTSYQDDTSLKSREEWVSNGYDPPVKANPGNVIRCIVGGGVMGHRLCHENEAPFPEDLAEFFVKSFCPPGGTVLDPFSGSGTTICVAKKYGRNGKAIDIREDQIALGRKRIQDPCYERAT